MAASLTAVPCFSLDEVCAEQEEDEVVQQVKADILNRTGPPSGSVYYNIRRQLVVVDNVLYRSVKIPPGETVLVPVIPASLEEQVVKAAHQVSGHTGWEATWRLLRSCCHFPGMAQ